MKFKHCSSKQIGHTKTYKTVISGSYMSRFANNALLGGGVRVRVWIREQRKIKRRSKALLMVRVWIREQRKIKRRSKALLMVRVWIREQRKIKRRSKALLSLCWQSWTSLLWLRCMTAKDSSKKGVLTLQECLISNMRLITSCAY